jgi:hypothetical protein
MKKIYTKRKGKMLVVPQHGYFRRLVRQFFDSLMKRQNNNRLEKKMDTAVDVLKDMRGSIEIMAREMARRSRRNS